MQKSLTVDVAEGFTVDVEEGLKLNVMEGSTVSTRECSKMELEGLPPLWMVDDGKVRELFLKHIDGNAYVVYQSFVARSPI